MIIDRSMNVISINPSELFLLDPPLSITLGFDSGEIKKGDIIIWARNHRASIDSAVFDALNLFSESKLFGDDISIAVFAFNEIGQQPIVIPRSNRQSLDTIFNSVNIKLQFKEDDSIGLSLNNFIYSFELTSYGYQMLVVDLENVKFFVPNHFNQNDFCSLLLSRSYQSYINLNALTGLSLNTRGMPENVINIIQESISSDKPLHQMFTFFERFHAPLLIESEPISNQLYKFSFLCEKNLDAQIEYFVKSKKVLNHKTNNNFTKSINAYEFTDIFGYSQVMNELKNTIGKVSKTNATVLILGESGTGKTLIAKSIHLKSKRSDQPFIVVNCAAIPETLIESELFGYEEGAFTGAKRQGKQGYFELANGGTLFLDEIGELPLTSQSRLLEVLQDQSFFRVGGSEKVKVNVRIIAATNQDLEYLVKEKTFRRDLFYRLNVFPVVVPALKDRSEDIEMLSKKILPKVCQRLEIEPLVISKEAITLLKSYHWPGNVRELENIIEQAAILCEGTLIEKHHIKIMSTNLSESHSDLKTVLENFEKEVISKYLKSNHHNKNTVAKLLGIGRTTLFEKIKKYGLEEVNHD